MSTLRWILLIAGIIVIAGIYFFGRSKQQNNAARQEPALGQLDTDLDVVDEPQEEEATADWEKDLVDFDNLIAEGLQSEVEDFKASNSNFKEQAEDDIPAPAQPKPQLKPESEPKTENSFSMLLDDELVVLHLLARTGKPFTGEVLYAAFSSAGFQRLDNSIFSCKGNEGSYLAVNALKPGIFPEQAEELETKAIGLILRLSQTKIPLAAFEELLLCARFLQDKLDARLCDGQRSSLTGQTIHYLQEEIQAYQHKHR